MNIQEQETLNEQRALGCRKLKKFSLIQLVLASATFVSGAATLGVAGQNIGFPVFNFGPLLAAIIFFIGGVCGLAAARKGSAECNSDVTISSSVRCYMIGHFTLCVTDISIATLASVFAFISGAVCAGANIKFCSGNNRNSNNCEQPIDVKQYCSPYQDANTALGFLDGVLCVMIAIWCIVGCVFVCYYGRLFGFKSRHRRRCQYI